MTETKTPDPDCPNCAGTGSIPPFMDDCPCEQPALPHPGPLRGPATGTVTKIIEADGTAVTKVWTGTAWEPVETEALTAAEYAAKYGTTATTPDWLPPLTSTPMIVTATVSSSGDADFDELMAEANAWDAAQTDNVGEALAYAAAAADVDEVDAEAEFEVVRTDDVVTATMSWSEPLDPPAPKTSADTFSALVAACDAIPAPAPAPLEEAGWTPKPVHTMSPSQEALLAKLIAERDPANVVVVAVITSLAMTSFDKKKASRLIDALMAVPVDPARKPDRENSYDGVCKDCGGPVPAKTGVIRKVDGRWVTFHKSGGCLSAEAKAAAAAERIDEPGLYKHIVDADHCIEAVYRVRKSRTSHRLYGEKVIPHPDGNVEFAYNANAMSFLRRSDKLTWAEARAFGAAYGCCVACGRTLSDARSLVQGYGATCAGHYRWPTVTAKQAEAIIAGTVTWEDVISGLGVLTS